MSTKNRCETN